MKYFLLFLIIKTILLSEENSKEKTLIEIKDTSGLSEWEVRLRAEISDKKDKKSISLEEVYELTDTNGSVDMENLQTRWEHQTPSTNGFDWIKTKSGEWFKGAIKAMYDDSLEFDSDEIGLYEFDFKDVVYIKTHKPLNVNIEEVASVSGIIRLSNEEIRIIQGDTEYKFPRSQIVSFAPAGELERNYWSGKVSLSFDGRQGNKNQFDYTAQIKLTRRTDSDRLTIDYLGRMSEVEGYQTANDHRLTESYAVYITKRFYWTPLISEFYRDKFQNVEKQITGAVGLGYTIIDKEKLTWDIYGGPGIVHTEYFTVKEGEDSYINSASLETRTKLVLELNKKNDLIYDYKFTFTNKDSGTYKHHMILSLENELLSWLDIDISAIWDHTTTPTKLEDGTIPFRNDYQFLFGLGIDL